MIRIALTLSLLSLAGCATTAETPRGTCKADGAQDLVGRPYDAAAAKRIMAATGAKTVRTVGPDQVVTLEYRYDRATVDVDASNRITRIGCG